MDFNRISTFTWNVGGKDLPYGVWACFQECLFWVWEGNTNLVRSQEELWKTRRWAAQGHEQPDQNIPKEHHQQWTQWKLHMVAGEGDAGRVWWRLVKIILFMQCLSEIWIFFTWKRIYYKYLGLLHYIVCYRSIHMICKTIICLCLVSYVVLTQKYLLCVQHRKKWCFRAELHIHDAKSFPAQPNVRLQPQPKLHLHAQYVTSFIQLPFKISIFNTINSLLKHHLCFSRFAGFNQHKGKKTLQRMKFFFLKSIKDQVIMMMFILSWQNTTVSSQAGRSRKLDSIIIELKKT